MATFTAHVQVVDLDATVDDGGVLAARLDPEERARAAAFASDRDRRRYTAAHGLLREAVARRLALHPAVVAFDREPCRACGRPHGRPVVSDHPALHVSLSRSGRFAAIAVAQDARVGIDLEPRLPPRDLEPLRRDIVAPGEAVASSPVPDLLATWVRKEAWLKATGAGLTRPMWEVELNAVSPGRWTVRESPADTGSGPARGLVVDLAAGPDVVVALAVADFDPGLDHLQFTIETPAVDTVRG